MTWMFSGLVLCLLVITYSPVTDERVVVVDKIELNYLYDYQGNNYLIQLVFWKGGDWLVWRRFGYGEIIYYDLLGRCWVVKWLGSKSVICFKSSSFVETHTQYDPAPGSNRVEF